MMSKPPFTYEFLNSVEGSVSPSFLKIHNTATARFFKKYLMQEAISIFDWNLPETWDSDYFRYVLMGWGFLAVFNTDKFGVIPNQCTLTGFNVFYRPTRAVVANPLINSRDMLIGKDCEIIRLMPDYGNISDLVDYYGDLMALTYETLSTNILNSKLSFVFGAENAAEAATYKSMFDDIASGQPAVVLKRKRGTSPNNPDWQTFSQNLAQNFVASEMLDTLDGIRDAFLMQIGIPTLSTRKKERVSVDESQKNTDETRAKYSLWFDELDASIKRVNSMFGLDVSVKMKYNGGDGNDGSKAETVDNGSV